MTINLCDTLQKFDEYGLAYGFAASYGAGDLEQVRGASGCYGAADWDWEYGQMKGASA